VTISLRHDRRPFCSQTPARKFSLREVGFGWNLCSCTDDAGEQEKKVICRCLHGCLANGEKVSQFGSPPSSGYSDTDIRAMSGLFIIADMDPG
jgi:hypothetical protein